MKDHVLVKKGPFLVFGHRIHPAMGNLAWNIPGHIDREPGRTNFKNHLLAIKGHILATSKERGLFDTPRIVKFGLEPPWAH